MKAYDEDHHISNRFRSKLMEMLWLLAGSTSIQITWNLGLSRPFCRAWITTLVPSCIRLHCLRDASMNSDLNWLEVFSRLDQLDLHDEHFLSKALVLLQADYLASEMLFGGANILNVTAVTMTCKGPNLSCIKHKVLGCRMMERMVVTIILLVQTAS